MHLVAVTAGGRRAVVADRDGQEVEHQVRIRDLVVAADEPARLEVVRRTGPGAEEQPLEPDPGPVAPLHRRRHRDGLLGPVLDVDLEVVLQVLADAGQVVHDVDARAPRARSALPTPESWSSCGELIAPPQRITSPASIRSGPVASRHLDADRARAVEEDPVHERAAAHLEVRPLHHRVEVRAGRAEAPAAVDVAVEGREALLPVPVDVVGERVARLLHRLEERLEQRVRRRAALEHERAVAAPVRRRRRRGRSPCA